MTNRRPDIHCDGCGNYSHSLSHRLWEQEFPARPFYGKCCTSAVSSGEKTGRMVNYEWGRHSQSIIDRLEGALSELEKSTLGSFIVTMKSSPTETISYNQKRPAAEGLRMARKIAESQVDFWFENGQIHYTRGNFKPMDLAEWKNVSEAKLLGYEGYCRGEQFTILKQFIARVTDELYS